MSSSDSVPPIVQTLLDFASIEPENQKGFLGNHPELRTVEADNVLGQMILFLQEQQDQDQEMILALIDARMLLRQVRDRGLERTFAFVEQAQHASPGPPGFIELLQQVKEETIRYENTGDQSALDDAVATWESILAKPELKTTSADWQGQMYYETAFALLKHYELSGQAQELDRALELVEQGLAIVPPDWPSRAMMLNLSGIILRQRSEHFGRLADLEQAIQFLREAAGSPFSDPVAGAERQNNLGNSLHELYTLTEHKDTLDEALAAYQKAVDITLPGSYSRIIPLHNLAHGLVERYDRSSNRADLDLALRYSLEDLQLVPFDSPEKPSCLQNLALVQQRLARATQDPQQLADAISNYTSALDGLPSNAPDRAQYLLALGSARRDQYRQTGDPADLEAGVRALREACQYASRASLVQCLRASRMWGTWAFDRGAWDEAAEAAEYALKAVDGLFSNQLARGDKQTWLGLAQSLPAQAAYAFARAGQLTRAVEVLEAARTRLLAEAQERDRTDLENLKESGQAPLYARYCAAAARIAMLEKTDAAEATRASNLDRVQQIDAARLELNAAVEDIRALPGYEDFLMSPTFSQIQQILTLQASADAGPSMGVHLVITSAGGVALITHPGGVEPVWLDVKQQGLFNLLLERKDGKFVGGYLQAQLEIAKLKQTLAQVQAWLGQQIMQHIAAALLKLFPANSTASSRLVHLVPTGHLALLPLHAALYALDGKTRTFLDDFVVAYAPSAGTLRHARRALMTLPGSLPDFFGVGNPLPLPEGLAPLKFAEMEVEEIARLFGERATTLCQDKATRAEVDKHMRESRYLHLSCHGLFDPMDPLASSLYLSGGEKIALGALLAGPRFGVTRLAVLSACQTAITDFNELPEEAIGLPAGFLQLGVPGVIGSLWPVNDLSTMLLMARLYQYHLQGDPETGQAPMPPAQALRRAQLWLRDATSEQLTALFKQYKETAPDQPTAPRMPFATASQYYAAFTFKSSKSRPFDNAAQWAAFAFYGL